jgi:hypothetical protein
MADIRSQKRKCSRNAGVGLGVHGFSSLYRKQRDRTKTCPWDRVKFPFMICSALLHRKEKACEHWRGGGVRKLQPAD